MYELPSDVDGVPDGAQCDADGCLWVALSGAGKVVRVSRYGGVDHEIELPVKSPTSVTFGGPDLDTLFVTTRGPDGGSLYAVRAPVGIRGVPEVAFGDATPVLAGAPGGMVTAGGMGLGRVTNGVADVVGMNGDPRGVGAKFCGNCGTAFGAEARFCSQCGCHRS